jgi:hypothetical protein
LDVVGHEFCQLVVSDAAEAGSNDWSIVATGHVARKGDIIRITGGANINTESMVYDVPDANTIILAEALDNDIAATDSFDILRFTRPLVTSLGGLATAFTFVRDGATQQVIEDTGTPANNRPLPVKLTGLTGDVSITAANLNLDVQLTDLGANADAVRIGDGTNRAGFNADGSVRVGNATAALDTNAGVVGAQTLRVAPATDSPHLLNTRHENAATPLSTRAGNGANFFDSQAIAAAQKTVATATAVPVGLTAVMGWDSQNSTHKEITTDENGNTSTMPATKAATFQAEGSLNGVSLTGSYQTVATAAGNVRIVVIRNTCNQEIVLSLDSGSSDTFTLDEGDTITLDLGVNGRHLTNAVTVRAKHAGTVPTAGKIRVTLIY